MEDQQKYIDGILQQVAPYDEAFKAAVYNAIYKNMIPMDKVSDFVKEFRHNYNTIINPNSSTPQDRQGYYSDNLGENMGRKYATRQNIDRLATSQYYPYRDTLPQSKQAVTPTPTPQPTQASNPVTDTVQAVQRYMQNIPQQVATTAGQGWNSFVAAAQKVAQETGFPLAVMLGQAANETGRSANNAPGNNYFGIKGGGNAGSTNQATWEDYGQGRVNTNANFAAYQSPEDAARAYVNLIKNNYPSAWEKRSDPVAMIQEIKKGGYATDPAYVQKVIGTPEFRQYVNQNSVQPQVQKPVVQPKASPTPRYVSVANNQTRPPSNAYTNNTYIYKGVQKPSITDAFKNFFGIQ